MNDDIVTRLREVHRPTVMQAHPSALCVEAADEIERLRKLGDALADGIRTGRWDDALDAWTELRGD